MKYQYFAEHKDRGIPEFQCTLGYCTVIGRNRGDSKETIIETLQNKGEINYPDCKIRAEKINY